MLALHKISIKNCQFHDKGLHKNKAVIPLELHSDIGDVKDINFILDTGSNITCISVKSMMDIGYPIEHLVGIWNNNEVKKSNSYDYDGSIADTMTFPVPNTSINALSF